MWACRPPAHGGSHLYIRFGPNSSGRFFGVLAVYSWGVYRKGLAGLGVCDRETDRFWFLALPPSIKTRLRTIFNPSPPLPPDWCSPLPSTRHTTTVLVPAMNNQSTRQHRPQSSESHSGGAWRSGDAHDASSTPDDYSVPWGVSLYHSSRLTRTHDRSRSSISISPIPTPTTTAMDFHLISNTHPTSMTPPTHLDWTFPHPGALGHISTLDHITIRTALLTGRFPSDTHRLSSSPRT